MRRARTQWKKTPLWKRLGLVLLFAPLVVVGAAKAFAIGCAHSFSNGVKRAFPSLWRATLGRKFVHKGVRFEDYSERRAMKSNGELLAKDALGAAGERYAFNYFHSLPRCKIIACNAENYYCELDLVYLDRKSREIVFVEIKTRRRENNARPTLEAVDAKRRKKIALASRVFVQERGYLRFKRRYDIVVIIWSEGEKPIMRTYENAFRESDALRDYQKNDFGKNRTSQSRDR